MTDTLTGAEALIRMLQLHGVQACLRPVWRHQPALLRRAGTAGPWHRHILTRDERSAAYMADGYARVTGRVGVCEGPSGGGATYLLPGLVEANESSVPVLGFTSDVPVSSRGKYPLTELDQQSLYRPLTKWNGTVQRADQLPHAVRTAFRAMTTGRPGAAHLCLPFDVLKQPLPAAELWAQPGHETWPALRSAPDAHDVERAADLLVAARAPVLVCGGGVVNAGACDALAALAEALNAPVCTTVSGRGSVADTHPLHVGVVGANGGVPATKAVLAQADLVLFIACRIGSTTTEHWQTPSRQVTILHIDADPMTIGANYRTAVGLVGDARLALQALGAAVGERLPAGRPMPPTAGPWRRGRGPKSSRLRRTGGIDRAPDQARGGGARAEPPAAAAGHRGGRPRARPAPTCRPTSSSRRPAATSSPTARTARWAMRCPRPSAPPSAGPTPRWWR
jgi:acetolactate synthase-1/2/3 large subunit